MNNYKQFGALVALDPKKAHAALVALFAKHGTRIAVGEALASDSRTVGKWIKRLEEQGLPDPRDAAARRGEVRPRRRASPTEEEKARARGLRRRGWSLERISEDLGGLALSSVARICEGVAPPEKTARKA